MCRQAHRPLALRSDVISVVNIDVKFEPDSHRAVGLIFNSPSDVKITISNHFLTLNKTKPARSVLILNKTKAAVNSGLPLEAYNAKSSSMQLITHSADCYDLYGSGRNDSSSNVSLPKTSVNPKYRGEERSN